MLNELLRRYRTYNPASGEFDTPRGVREYARLLGVNDGQLSQILNDIQRPGLTVIQALARTFPQAAPEIAAALADTTVGAEREAISA
ncbi:MAG TPA: helix-turn-helix transcriptional regulator [Thermomicrobiales bacterium]|jgi:transcriptional regulator with XRE-family HTH domain